MKLLVILLSILESFLAGMETQTLTADFTLAVTAEATQPLNYSGHLTMRGEQFHLSMATTEAAYDGKTLYVYDEATDEMTLSSPTDEDLLITNPFLYARAIYKECTIAERKSKSGDVDVITLTPKNQSAGILRFILRLRNNLPVSIEVKETNQSTRIQINNARYTSEQQKYTLSKPGAFVVDMR